MDHKGANIARDLTKLAADCVRLSSDVAVNKHVGTQLLRAATSAGANYAEARGAESRRDFVHKLSVAEKELRETRYWLEIVQAASDNIAMDVDGMRVGADRLVGILYVSIRTARRGLGEEVRDAE